MPGRADASRFPRLADALSPLATASSRIIRVSGIPSHADKNDFGRTPTAGVAGDVEAWEQWYAEHGRELAVDPASGRLVRRPASSSR